MSNDPNGDRDLEAMSSIRDVTGNRRSCLGGQRTFAVGHGHEALGHPGPLTLVYWNGNDSDTTNVLVMVTSPGIEGLRVRPYAKVTFGTHGTFAVIEADIGTGTRFTVGGSCVYVDGALEQCPGAKGVAGINAMLSFTARPPIHEVTRTRYLDDLAEDEKREVIVPAFARDVACWRHPSGGPLMLRFLDSASRVLHEEVVEDGVARRGLLPETSRVAVENRGGGASVRLVFGLGGFESLFKAVR